MDCVKCVYNFHEHEVGDVCTPCMADQRIADMFTPSLSYDKVQLFKQKRCIYCGADASDLWCPEVPLCTHCDAVDVAIIEEALEVPWSTFESEE